MKSALSMLFYYFAATVAGVLAAAVIFMISCDLTILVAGESVKFFNGDFFVRGLLSSFPLVVSVVIFMIVLYGLRHKENHFVRLFTFIFLGALTWCVLIPASFNLEKKYNDSFAKQYEVPYLSAGYFRPEAGGVFYFSRVQDNGTADGLFIDLTGITGEQGSVVKFTGSLIDEDFSGQFSDSLIRDAIKLPFVVVAPLEMYSTGIAKAKAAWSTGYGSWLVFCIFALALLSVYAFQYFSSWNLINALAIVITGGIICVVNFMFYAGLLFGKSSVAWSEYFYKKSLGATGFVKSFFLSEDPLLALINCIIFAVLLVTGILLYVFNGRKRKGDN